MRVPTGMILLSSAPSSGPSGHLPPCGGKALRAATWGRPYGVSGPPLRRAGVAAQAGFSWPFGPIHHESACLRFRLTAKTAPAPLLLLFPANPLRWASIRFGTADRDHPHTASVLTWLKIEERQTFAVRSLYAPKRLCPKGFRLLQAVAPLEISLEIRRKQTDLPRGGLRPSERLMISWRI